MPRTRHRGPGWRRAEIQAGRAGAEVRLARRLHGMSQLQLAIRCGVARSTIARIEHGDPAVQLDTLCHVAAAAGIDVVLSAYPAAGPRLRDSGQLEIAQQLSALAHPSWRPAIEVPAGDHGRSADLVFFGPTEILHVEIERAAVDLQAQLRPALAKRAFLATQHQRPVRLVLAVSDTYRSRHATRPFLSIIGTTLPAGSREVLRALRSGEPLGMDGLLWVPRPRLPRGHGT